MNSKWLFLAAGVFLGAACGAHGNFPYHYYALSLPADCYAKGQLLGKSGHEGWRDIPLRNCQPDAQGNMLKCITILDGDFYSAKGDFLKCESDLSACQKRCK